MHNVCLICDKPLGQDSKDQGYPLCHEHRKCQKCGEDLYPYEAKVVIETFDKVQSTEANEAKKNKEEWEPLPIEKYREYLLMDIVHPACRLNDPTALVQIRASEYKFLNLIRNLVMPEMDASVNLNGIRVQPHAQELIADMEYEKLARTLERMESTAQLIRIAISQDPDNKKKQVADKHKFEQLARDEIAKATKPTKESTQPKEPSEKEVAYKDFLITFSMQESQESKKTFSSWFKSIKGMQSAGMPYEIAKEMASAALKKGLNQ